MAPDHSGAIFMLLSILVPSVNSRHATFARRIQEQLFSQYDKLPQAEKCLVEIIVLVDTKSMVLGDKRNKMVELAQGEYVVFVDDDDRIAEDYIAALLQGCASGRDAVTFNAMVTINGGLPKVCRYSLMYQADANLPHEYQRLPNHICAVKREHALAAGFPSLLHGEDAEYAKRLKLRLQSEYNIARTLYYYDYQAATSETTPKPQQEAVDVVVLSKASTERHQQMTQHTIDTCRKNAGSAAINIFVIEQVEGVEYAGATVAYDPSPFNFNEFANNGARMGTAPWLMIANNDLQFEPNWLAPLIAAGHPVVSPVNPIDRRHAGVRVNKIGDQNGKHFSGWCFMLRREVWERIGGFDEDFRFWCADDAVIEQLRAVGITPMLVARSRVRHAISQTLKADDGTMTWAQVYKFEQKYGIAKFPNDHRYMAWKEANGV